MQDKFTKVVQAIMLVLALFMAFYHLLYTQWMIMGPIHHQNFHYMMALTLVFLWVLAKERSVLGRVIALALIALSIYATTYMFIHFEALQEERAPMLDLTTQDLVVGVLLVLLGIEASRRSFGMAFPIVAAAFISYAIFGHNLPGPLAAPRIDLPELLTSYGLGLSGGIYGQVLGISANYIFLFVLFGGLLGATGASRFFNQIGTLAGSKLSGGPAITAVVSSALVGSVTGSVMANVATTGPFTIPLMKKAGYKPYQAAAIEAAASSGGQIIPPVMGATAFIMAELSETPYVKVMAAALIPSLLYFLSVGIYAQLQAKKMRITMDDSVKFSLRQFFHDAPIFVLPLFSIIVLLVMGYSPMFTIFWAMMILFLLNIIDIVHSKDYSQFKKLLPAFKDGAVTGAKIAVTCAVLGPIMTTVTKTLLGIKIPQAIAMWCDGSVGMALVLTMIVSLVLGLGVPTLAAYLLVSMVGVPVLVDLGVMPFSAHMFVFIYASFACLTPPVSIAALPAAGIAQAPYLRTAMEATIIGCTGFIIPFLVVSAPELMLIFGTATETIFSTSVSAFVILALGVAICGYFFRLLSPLERILSASAALLGLIYMFSKNWMLLVTALAVFALVVFLQKRGIKPVTA